jgi:alkylated DNA repair dioxygenase AlkB
LTKNGNNNRKMKTNVKTQEEKDPSGHTKKEKNKKDSEADVGNIQSIRKLTQKFDVDFIPHLISRERAKEIYTLLEQQIFGDLQEEQNKRTTTLYGDDGLTYRVQFGGYDGRPLVSYLREAIPWKKAPTLLELRQLVGELTDTYYNFCAIQRYPNGKTGIAPHKDKEMVPGTTICCLSFGATRTLVLHPPSWLKHLPPRVYRLSSGSFYSLNPPTNDHWFHEIIPSKTKKVRISLTFRNLPTENTHMMEEENFLAEKYLEKK